MRYLKFGIIAAAVVVIALLIIFAGPRRREATFFPMGGMPFKVVAYGRTFFQFKDDMKAVEAKVGEFESAFDRFNASSELAKLNSEGATAPFTPSKEMAEIVDLSRKWHKETEGAFDPSVGPLVDLWKDASNTGTLPSDDQVAKALRLVDFDKVSAANGGRLLLARNGMTLDFGAIAKGYIDDYVARMLMARGVARGVVDAGGNALAFGKGSFRFGIQDPTATERGMLMATVEVGQGAVITSGNYERYVEVGRERYSHIIDPRTGRPVDNGMVSATVIGGSGADADALATALIVLGRKDAIELLNRLKDFEAVLVEKGPFGYWVYASKGIAPKLRLIDGWKGRLREF